MKAEACLCAEYVSMGLQSTARLVLALVEDDAANTNISKYHVFSVLVTVN